MFYIMCAFKKNVIKHVLYYVCMYMRAIKKFLDIITKVAPKVYLQLWRRSHWFGSGVSEECSNSKHLNEGLPVLSAPVAVFGSKLPKGLGM